MNRRTSGIAALTLAALATASAPSLAQDNEDLTFAEAMSSGKFSLGVRYRYEYVNDDNPALIEDTANASTILLRMNYKTAAYKKFSGFAEFDYVGEVLSRDFNNLSGDPGRSDYPVVADPKGADLNQLYLDYDPSEFTKLRGGRQRIVLDNQRFVGGVAWRQNEQTYDAITLNMKAAGNTEFKYSFVNRVRRITGNKVPSGRHRVDAHLLNVKVRLGDNWSVIPYYYYLDYKDAAQFGLSTATFGARIAGNIPVGESKLALLGEFANQADIGDNPVSYDAAYYHLTATFALKNSLSFGLGYESLGGDAIVGGSAFRTPLATLHLFQGWADKFLATPDAGVEDLYLTVKGKLGKWNLTGVYHDFSAEALSADWGTEFDFSAGRKLNDRYGILLKAAFYDADQQSFDTTKFWVMFTGNY